MKHISIALILSGGLAALAAHAQADVPLVLAQAAAGTSAMADGEVRKVDKGAGKITLKHGEIKSLEMPAMTMVFQVKDKAMLDQVKAGDKVRFSADKLGGAFTITQIETAK